MHGLCMPHRSWSVSLSTLFLCMLWLPTLELDRKIQKQSWQVVANLDTMEVLKNNVFSSFTNLMIIYRKRFGLWEQLLQHISLQCMAVKFITTIQREICMHNDHWHSVLGLNCIIVLSLCMIIIVDTATPFITCRALPFILVTSVFVIMLFSSNHMLVTEASTCSCWCLPTLGNVLPLAISVDSVS